MTNSTPKSVSSLAVYLNEGGHEIPVLGQIVWWSIRDVNFTQPVFLKALTDSGLPEKYAREHNYRAALTRALKDMENESLVRRVKEDDVYVIFQFTTEKPTQNEDNPHLKYTPKVVVTIDKEAYGMFLQIERSIKSIIDPSTEQPPEDAAIIQQQLITLFESHKITYKSSDITRYIQQIFKDNADLLSLREQGSIYFVPAAFSDVVNKVKTLFTLLGMEGSFQFIPIPDIVSTRQMVGNSFGDEAMGIIKDLKDDFEKLEEGKEVTEQWLSHRRNRIKGLRDRIARYNDLLDTKWGEIHGSIDYLDSLTKPRVIELG